jgi:hypothetical protein
MRGDECLAHEKFPNGLVSMIDPHERKLTRLAALDYVLFSGRSMILDDTTSSKKCQPLRTADLSAGPSIMEAHVWNEAMAVTVNKIQNRFYVTLV